MISLKKSYQRGTNLKRARDNYDIFKKNYQRGTTLTRTRDNYDIF